MRPGGRIRTCSIAWGRDKSMTRITELLAEPMSDFGRYQYFVPGARPFGGSIKFMNEEVLLAGEYRKHAKALRAAAKFDREAKTSLILKRIAEDFEQVALALEGADGASKFKDDMMRKLPP